MRWKPSARTIELLCLVSAMGCLATGVWGGLLRLVWDLPAPSAWWITHHGPLMVSGFLGTLIGLERAVALGGGWTRLVPALAACGGLSLAAGLPGRIGPGLLLLSSIGLVAVTLVARRMRRSLAINVAALGAGAWCAGNALWIAGLPLSRVVPWWGAFLVLTIAGERLELTRFRRRSAAGTPLFLIAVAILLAGLSVGAFVETFGHRLGGAGFSAIGVWLLRYDVALRNVRERGLQRFIALSLICGYAWLAVAGVVLAICAPLEQGLPYDAVLHALFLGFVFSAILAHAPLVLPAVTGVAVPFRPALWVPLALLHVSVLLRVGGDLGVWIGARRWGGLGNAVAIGAFFLTVAGSLAVSAVRGAISRRARRRGV